MKKYNGSGLTPLFHSEISSSYMLYDILKSQEQIALHLIKDKFNILPDKIIVARERVYPKKGSIDIFIEFMKSGNKYALLIEIKVHDYLSATDDQIITYYNAALEDSTYGEIFFIYLTQFTEENNFQGIVSPKTIDEAKKAKDLIKDRFVHISWEEMHKFLAYYYEKLTEEQQLIISLNKQWILQKCQADLEVNKIEVGERGLEDYFFDQKIDLRKALPFGSEIYENKRQIWRIDVSLLDEKQLDAVLHVIETYTEANTVNKIKQFNTEELTLQGAKDFLAQLAQSTEEWKLLSFYSKLFRLAEKASYLKFHGTGTRGFSIKLEIQAKGEISLCTIYRNKTIDFSLKR